MVFDNTINVGNILTLVVICIALFGPGIRKSLANIAKKRQINPIVRMNLDQLKKDLSRIVEKRNNNASDKITFSKTSFCEISNYYFLFSDILIPNAEQLKLADYPKTIDFFIHYKMNMDTLKARKDDTGDSSLTRATVDLLLQRLENAINDFRSPIKLKRERLRVMEQNETVRKGNPENGQRTALENMHKIFLEVLRHREQEILRFLAILAPALGGFIWLLKLYSEGDVKPVVFIVGTLGVLFLLMVGAVYSLALGYNFRTIIHQLATLESEKCLNIDKYILSSWPRKTEDFKKFLFKKMQKIPWCSPPEIIRTFWWAFNIGIIGVTVVGCYECPTRKRWIILSSGMICFFASMYFPYYYGKKIHSACD